MKIILMRHGQPEIDLYSLKKVKLSPYGLGGIITEYEHTDLDFSLKPTELALKIAEKSKIIFSSQMPRAISSIKMLGVEDKTIFDEELKESALPFLNWKSPRLSFFTWCIIFRIAWMMGFSKNGESLKLAQIRAEKITIKLLDHAMKDETILLLGHGIMNRLITKILKKRGWKQSETTGDHYWSYSTFKF